MASRSPIRKAVLTAALLAGLGAAPQPDLSFSAAVDKTTAAVREPVQLTLTLSGDIAGIQLPECVFPEGWVVVAQSQATNFSIRAGAADRSISLSYVLIASRTGTFQLGPFTVKHQDKSYKTEPIQITVNKPSKPPEQLSPEGGRYTL